MVAIKEKPMKKIHNILFVSQGVADETEALKQALSIARNNNAQLKALIVCPELPKALLNYKDNYETSLVDRLQKSIQKGREAIQVADVDVPVQIKVESGSGPAIRIVRQVLQESFDLVIKEAEPQEGGKGFRSMDMELLRKCPCPVWLCRPIGKHRDEIKIAVAIDPESSLPAGHDLSLRLLEISRALADTCSCDLNIVSCWDYEIEEYLRNNMWVKMQEYELKKAVNEAQQQHRNALEELIEKSGIGGKTWVHHIRGRADQMIPKFVEDKKIDILVMGTVARTGIQSLVIGNTAENILQKIACSLLALKPNGFVSPVKAY